MTTNEGLDTDVLFLVHAQDGTDDISDGVFMEFLSMCTGSLANAVIFG